MSNLAGWGHTHFKLRDLQLSRDGNPMVPLSVMGCMRKEMVRQLSMDRGPLPPRHTAQPQLAQWRTAFRANGASECQTREPALHVLCRTLQQFELLASIDNRQECRVERWYVDFADIREYRQATDFARRHRMNIFLATPRIQKPGETGMFAAMARHAPDGVLVRNLAALDYFNERRVPVVADFSLNAANELAVDQLLQWGANRVTPSYDLNRDQLLSLLQYTNPRHIEVVIHQYMPMFHMEHCVFCAVLSPGTNKTNCGRPCDVHEVSLRDRVGMEHPLTADVGCRNTLFNAQPQSAADVVPELVRLGVREFRIELLRETAGDSEQSLRLYRQLLLGRVSGKQVWQQLNALNRVGVTRGTLEHERNPLALL